MPLQWKLSKNVSLLIGKILIGKTSNYMVMNVFPLLHFEDEAISSSRILFLKWENSILGNGET